MLHPLSLATYYRRNKTRVGIVVCILALSLLAVASIGSLTGSFRKDANTGLIFFNNFATLTYTASPEQSSVIEERIVQELEDSDEIADFFIGDAFHLRKEALAGRIEVTIGFLNETDQQKFLVTNGLQLSEGKLPEPNSNQLVITKKLADNRRLQLGDRVGDAIRENEPLPGEYEIVGFLTPVSDVATPIPDFTGMGDLGYSNTREGAQRKTVFIHPVRGQLETFNDRVEVLKDALKKDFPDARVDLTSERTLANQISENFKFMDIMVWSIMSIIMVVMTVSIALFNIIIFMQRANEFGLLLALGYSRGFILRKTLTESLTQIVLAIALGLVTTLILFAAMNNALFEPNGFAPLVVLEKRNLLYTIPIPLAVAVFSILTILWNILRLDPISILERRD